MSYVMDVNEFIKGLKKALNSKTLYVHGCFGAPMTSKNKTRYTKNTSYNMQPERQAMINNASSDTFGFDCVCLIKGILWGWSANPSLSYGGAQYASNGVPDIGADGMFSRKYVTGISRDFAKIKPGAVLHISGHVGVYIGCGEVIECSPKWSNNVQISHLGNIGQTVGNWRTWDEYGYLPCVDYSVEIKKPEEAAPAADVNAEVYTVKSGDTLSKIGVMYGFTSDELAAYNGIANPNKIYPGQVIKIPPREKEALTPARAADILQKVKDGTPGGLTTTEINEAFDMAIKLLREQK